MSDLWWVVAFFAVVVAGGVWNRRRRSLVVQNPRVVVLSLDSDVARAHADAAEYRQQFSNVSESTDLASLARLGADIVHLLAPVTADGQIAGRSWGDMQRALAAAKPKLVIVGSENPGDAYISGLSGTSTQPYNLVLTIAREGGTFWTFFHRLFDLMFRGTAMPVAWNKLAPQIPGQEHANVPSAICQMGAGQLTFSK